MPKVKTKVRTETKLVHSRVVWSDSYYVTAYEALRDFGSKEAAAERIGCTIETFNKWLQEKPALKEAVEKALQRTDDTFADYVYRQLPPDLKVLWEEITRLDDEGDPMNQILKLLEDKGQRVKQYLFVHALVHSDFDPSAALSKLRIPKHELDKWVRQDPDFGRLCEEVVFHKGNFVEGALFRLVRQGDRNAIIFASKTLNANRGYGNRLKVTHDGEVKHSGQLSVEELKGLSLEDKKRILAAAKKQQDVEDAEYEVT